MREPILIDYNDRLVGSLSSLSNEELAQIINGVCIAVNIEIPNEAEIGRAIAAVYLRERSQ